MSNTLKLDDIAINMDNDLDDYRDLPDKAEEHIAELGIRLPPQPVVKGNPFVPSIPYGPDGTPSLSHLSHRELSDLNVQYLAYHDYVESQLKRHKIRCTTSAKVFDNLKRQIRLLHTGSPTERSDLTMADPRVQQAEMDFVDADNKYRLIEGVLNAVGKDMQVISREVTIREQETFLHRRSNNVQNIKHGDIKSYTSKFGLEEQEVDDEFFSKKKKRKKPR